MTRKSPMPARLSGRSTKAAAWTLALMMAFGATSAMATEHDAVDALIQGRKFDEALSRADQFLAGKPRDVQMRFLKGVAQLESNRRTEAIATFTQLTQDAPELPEPYNNLAVLHASMGQYDRARAALESALRTNPSYATAQENLGDVYARLAGDAYSQALQLGQNTTAVAPKLAVIRSVFPATGAAAATPAAAQLATSTTGPKVASAPAAPASAPAARAPAVPSPAPAAAPAAAAPAKAAVAPAPASAAAAPAKAPAPAPAVVAAAPATPPASAAPTAPAKGPAVAAAPVAPPAPVAAPKPTSEAPAAAAAVAATATQTAAVEKAVRAWAEAWAEQDMKAYLGAYASSFEVPAGSTRAKWEEERRQRIVGKSGIQVQLENLQISVDGDKAVARFLQLYRADALNVRSRKTLNLQKQGDAWRITREAVGGR